MTLSDLLSTVDGGTWPTGNQDEILNVLIEKHQALLPGDKIVAVLKLLPAELTEDPRVTFLCAVEYYHLQHKEKKKELQDWKGALKRFSEVHPATSALLAFYVPNYAFLACRNAGPEFWGQLAEFYDAAVAATEALPEPLQFQLVGFIQYNAGRHYLSNEKKPKQAVWGMVEAYKARKRFLEALRGDPSTSPEELLAARTQLWKIGNDWESLFGSREQCPMSEGEVAALKAEGVAEEFSAKK